MREGNLPRDSKCVVCKKACGSIECLAGMKCGWCAATVESLIEIFFRSRGKSIFFGLRRSDDADVSDLVGVLLVQHGLKGFPLSVLLPQYWNGPFFLLLTKGKRTAKISIPANVVYKAV